MLINVSTILHNKLIFAAAEIAIHEAMMTSCSPKSNIKQVVKVIPHMAADRRRTWSVNRIRQVASMCTPSNTCFQIPIGPPECTSQPHLDRFSRSVRLTIVTDRPTDRRTDHATPFVIICRIYVVGLLRCGLMSKISSDQQNNQSETT